MTHTIKTYRQVSQTRAVETTRTSSLQEIKRVFLRYAKTYRLAYGVMPSYHSLQIELSQYGGVTVEQLNEWMKEVVI